MDPLPGISLNQISPGLFPKELGTGAMQDTGIPGSGFQEIGTQGSFKDLMLQSLGHVNSMQQDADHAVEQLFTGGDANPAEVLTAVQKADMSFRMMLQVRNKLIEAYRTIQDVRI